MKENQERFIQAVNAYWDQGTEIGLKMKQTLRDEVGDEEMENLSNWYEARRDAQIEIAEYQDDPDRSQF